VFRRFFFSNHSQRERKLINLRYCQNSLTFEPLFARQSLKMICSSSFTQISENVRSSEGFSGSIKLFMTWIFFKRA